jgi:hypothetical protein
MAYQLRALSRWEEELLEWGRHGNEHNNGSDSDEDWDEIGSSDSSADGKLDGQKELQERSVLSHSPSFHFYSTRCIMPLQI